MSKLISVIIPSYNHEQYIADSVHSVLEQSVDKLELIIIDDGSTDNSYKILKKFKDKRIKLISQKNKGAHCAINKGLEVASGEYLSILNSDDIYHRDRLSTVMDYLESNPEYDIVTTWVRIINKDGDEIGVKHGWKDLLPWNIEKETVDFGLCEFDTNLIISNFVSTTSNIFMNRRVYENIGGMRNLKYAHDWDFMLRSIRMHRTHLMEEPLLSYRVHDTNTISKNRHYMLFEICWIWAVHLMGFSGDLILPEYKNPKYIQQIVDLNESIVTQGNDKLIWIIMLILQSLEKQNIKCPEEYILDNENLKDSLINNVVLD